MGAIKPTPAGVVQTFPNEGNLCAPSLTVRDTKLPSHFRVRLLGQFQIMAPDSQSISLRSKRSKAALAYLVLAHGNEATRERLAGLLWSDRSEPQARASLRQCIHEIRDSLPGGGQGLLVIERDRIALNADLLLTDIEEILSAIRGEDFDALEMGLQRLGTDVILGDLSISDMFDDWLAGERTAWNERILAAVKQRIERAEVDCAWQELRRLADAYLSRDLAAEDVLGMALRADVEQVGMAEAKRRFTRFEERLRRELDVEPSARLRRLLSELEEQSTDAHPAAHPSMPPRPTPTPGLLHEFVDLPTVVLTPFAAPSGGSSVHLAELISEEIEASLTRVRDLRVMSIPDAGLLPNGADAVDAVATFMLVGTFRQAGDSAILNVKLQSIERTILWSMRETFQIEKMEASIDKVVERIVGGIAPSIDRSIDQSFVRQEWSMDGAILAYCHARSLARSARSLEEARCAAEELEAVLERDHLNASAYLHLSRLYNTDFLHNIAGHDYQPLRERALMLTRTANELDPGNAHAQTSLGFCFLRRSRWEEAQVHLERGLELAPHHADRIVEAAMGLAYLGEVARAAKLVDLAIALNPYPHREHMADRALLQMLAGQHREAEQSFYASTDQGLHYMTARLANMGFLDAVDGRDALVDQVRERFRVIWQGQKPPEDHDILDWLRLHLTFRDESHRQIVHLGLSRAGMRI